jgi:hypothetical protein
MRRAHAKEEARLQFTAGLAEQVQARKASRQAAALEVQAERARIEKQLQVCFPQKRWGGGGGGGGGVERGAHIWYRVYTSVALRAVLPTRTYREAPSGGGIDFDLLDMDMVRQGYVLVRVHLGFQLDRHHGMEHQSKVLHPRY